MKQAASYNHCCSGKSLSVTYSVCVAVALFVQHAKCMCHSTYIVICGLFGSAIFFHILINSKIFSKKIMENEMRVLIFPTISV